jgi:ABC-type amino acid transport substrate-binding protein
VRNWPHPRALRPLAALLTLVAVCAVTACGVRIPADPDGTLDAVHGGELRAGVSPHEGFVEVDDGDPQGPEADAIRAFAGTLDAEVAWTVGSEEQLVRGLEDGALDVVAGGITDQTPWLDKAGVTRAYREAEDASGRVHKIVMLVPLGENAFLSELEVFLAGYVEAEAGR